MQLGDDIYGLLRAFMYAGAPAVLATLWRVDHRSTLIFAERFYQELQTGADYASALKSAQLFLRSLARGAAKAILKRYGGNQPRQEPQESFRLSLALHGTPRSTVSLDSILPGDDEDLLFADPVFWAPFVLIGDPSLSRSCE